MYKCVLSFIWLENNTRAVNILHIADGHVVFLYLYFTVNFASYQRSGDRLALQCMVGIQADQNSPKWRSTGNI